MGTLRWRLTLWYGVMALAMVILFSPLAFHLISLGSPLPPRHIDKARTAADQVGQTLEQTGSPSQAVEAVQDPEVWVVVRDAEGNELASTPGLEQVLDLDSSKQSLPDTQRSGEYFATSLKPQGTSGETVEVYTRLLNSASSFSRILTIQVVGAAVTLVLMLGLGPTLAAGALKPLRKVSAVAEELRRGRLESRVDLPELKKRRDEVGQVANSFDAMAESLERLFKAERASKESLQRFLADASHELRTPLTSILGYLDVLNEGGDKNPSVRCRALSAMREEAALMAHLVEDLLALARLESRQETSSQAVDLASLTHEVAASYPKRRIGVSADEPVVLMAEPDSLRRVVSNLLSNAVEHTPPEKDIKVSVERRNGGAILRVSDEGAGISEEDLPHIFDRFYRANGSRTREGTGLGLAIVKETVEAIGGRVEVQSAVQKGSMFTVLLPLSIVASNPGFAQKMPR
ncbi:MAG: HAMP domain-containing protein [Rubrobacter sp.]|nr:HAMP domain-containing protein [Rubrobacter sp.]